MSGNQLILVMLLQSGLEIFVTKTALYFYNREARRTKATAHRGIRETSTVRKVINTKYYRSLLDYDMHIYSSLHYKINEICHTL